MSVRSRLGKALQWLGQRVLDSRPSESCRLELVVAKDPSALVDNGVLATGLTLPGATVVGRDARSITLSFLVGRRDADRVIAQMECGTADVVAAKAGAQFVQSISVDGVRMTSHVPTVPSWDPVPLVPTSSQRIISELSDIDVVVMTATDVERETLHRFMRPLPGEVGLLEGAKALVTYRVGLFGRYRVAHIECSQGGLGRDASTLTVSDAIREAGPKAVLLLGIAFGVDRNRQRLGDVLIATSIAPYELERVGVVLKKRGEALPCGTTLLERFRSRRADWRLSCGLDEVEVHSGVVLSGEKLVDNKAFRDGLVAKFEGALGGEMEGAGAYAAANRVSVEMILVKSICDWADGHKDDRAQPFAAFSAMHLAHHVLSREDALSALGCVDRGPPSAGRASASSPSNLATRPDPSDRHSQWMDVAELLQKDKRVLRDDARRKWDTLRAEGARPPRSVVAAAEALIASADVSDDESYRLIVLLRETPPEDYAEVIRRLTMMLIAGTFLDRDDTSLAIAYEAAKFEGTVDQMIEWLCSAKRIGPTMEHVLSALHLFLTRKPVGYAAKLDALHATATLYVDEPYARRILDTIGAREDPAAAPQYGARLREREGAQRQQLAQALDIAIEWAKKLDLDNWKAWTSYVVCGGEPRLDIEHDKRLEELREWLIARIWPTGVELVQAAFVNFHLVLRDFQEVFRSRAVEFGSELVTEKFYKLDEWDPEKYARLHAQYVDHVDLVGDLLLELTRAANLVCDRVREHIDPAFRMREGKAVIESGPTMEMQYLQLPAEYRGDERTPQPYPGLERFKTARLGRADNYGFARAEDQPSD